MNLQYIWLALGVIFIFIGLSDLAAYGSWRSLLTIAIGALITYQTFQQLGGWRNAMYDIKWKIKKFLK